MRTPWRWLAGAAILAGVAQQTGSDPFVKGVSELDVPTLVLGACLAVVTTAAGAWRWHLVAGELGVEIGVPAAVASCYRSQFLNTVLPGGVLGDVHRGVVHGRAAGATGLALRAVWWERCAGQVVQVAIALAALLLLPSPVQHLVPWAVVLVVAFVLGVALLARRTSGVGSTRWRRFLDGLHHDVRFALLGGRSRPGIVTASTLAVCGHVATFLLAARAVGIDASFSTLLPLAVLVLVAAAVPLNLAGWGPREGMAAWAFAAAGLGAGAGVATAVAFGAMVFVANLPGLGVLLVARDRSAQPRQVEGRSAARRRKVPSGGASRA